MRLLIFFSFLSVALSSVSPLVQRDVPAQLSEQNLHIRQEDVHIPAPVKRQNSTDTVTIPKPSLLASASQADIDNARAIVNATLAQTAVKNKARLDNPIRNNYNLAPGTKFAKRDNGTEGTITPLLPITEEMANAAALIAEADAYAELMQNSTAQKRWLEDPLEKRATPFWMGALNHSYGTWPWGSNSSYRVFRDVTQPPYNAQGDGVTDDTAAIMKAVTDGNRCGPGCYGSTTLNAIIYFPQGKKGVYLVSSTIETYFGSQFVGDAINPPTIKASSTFTGLGVISTDKYVGGTGTDGLSLEYFINTANFYRQVRNLKIDITGAPDGIVGLHWQVAQATSLLNVEISASTSGSTTQQGIFAENGSGGFISDVTINGGAVGMYCGNQQFTSHRITFNGCQTAVQMIWDWGWTWKELTINGGNTGFAFKNANISDRGIGSALITDSVFNNLAYGIVTTPVSPFLGSGTTGITLDNVAFNNVGKVIVDTSNTVVLATPPTTSVWTLGNTYFSPSAKAVNLINTSDSPRDPSLVDPNNVLASKLPQAPYFTRAKPQYETYTANSFVHMKSYCAGDGVSDDTLCFQVTLESNVGVPIYIDAGTYMLGSTITIPSGSIIIGEAWSQLCAYGNNFNNKDKPIPLLTIGGEGNRGTVEMQDLIFTSQGQTEGLVVVEWDMRAGGQGQAAMWDCHVRLGGATGTQLTSANCPASTTSTDSSKCRAGTMMMHLSPDASAYLENVWLWVADHDIDDPDWTNDNNVMTQNSIYVARGMLVESTEATFMYGTASEHATFYQYTFYKAQNIIAGEIQTESPYYQPNPAVPSPFSSAVDDLYPGDPDYAACKNHTSVGCDLAWSTRFLESENITIHGAGLYSWFNDFSETCVDTQSCQVALVQMQDNRGSVRIYNLVTIGAETMIYSDSVNVTAKNNLEVEFHPYWSQIAMFDPVTNTSSLCTGTPSSTNAPVPSGSFVEVVGDTDQDASSWFVLVNGTPLDFVLDSEVQANMVEWNFSATVPAGESVQYTVFFNNDFSNPADAYGNATFRIGTTDKTFTVVCSFNSSASNYQVSIVYDTIGTFDMPKGGSVNLGFPVPGSQTNGRSVQWVLTGSELYGYWSSANPPVAWMHSILDIIGDRQLTYVTMPGTHDSGMSTIGAKTAFVSSDNTQTQFLDYYHALKRGARWFDTRPVISDGQYYLGHYSVDSAGTGLGGDGQLVATVISQVNQFMDDYPGELVILSLDSDSSFDTDESSYPRFTDAQWIALFNEFASGINKPCSTVDGRILSYVTMNEFIGDGVGCVAMITAGSVGTIYDNNTFGVFEYAQLPFYSSEVSIGSPSEENQQMATGEISKLKAQRNLVGTGNTNNSDDPFVMQWLIANNWDVTNPLYAYAQEAYGALFWYAYSQFTPVSYPTVLFMDYFGFSTMPTTYGETQDAYMAQTDGTSVALAMAVNLAIASQNCYAGGGTIY